MISIQILVQGRVQGVAFRYSTMQKAQQLRLSGFVRNQSDGSVYIEATGSSQELSEFSNWCKNGPSQARVESFEKEELAKTHEGVFQIR